MDSPSDFRGSTIRPPRVSGHHWQVPRPFGCAMHCVPPVQCDRAHAPSAPQTHTSALLTWSPLCWEPTTIRGSASLQSPPAQCSVPLQPLPSAHSPAVRHWRLTGAGPGRRIAGGGRCAGKFRRIRRHAGLAGAAGTALGSITEVPVVAGGVGRAAAAVAVLEAGAARARHEQACRARIRGSARVILEGSHAVRGYAEGSGEAPVLQSYRSV